MNDRINHPSHYEKGNGHLECIDLLEILTSGFSGIDAMEIGQAKYLYRAGSKSENGYGPLEKQIEDVKKFKWYINHFISRNTFSFKVTDTDEVVTRLKSTSSFQPMPEKSLKSGIIIDKVVEEFTFDKPEEIKEYYRTIITTILTFRSADELLEIPKALDKVIDFLEKQS